MNTYEDGDITLSKQNNMRLSLNMASIIRIGLDVIGLTADLITIVDMYKSIDHISEVSNTHMFCGKKVSQTIDETKIFSTTTKTFCAVRSIRGNTGYDPNKKNTIMYFKSEDDIRTYTACIKQRTDKEITLHFNNTYNYNVDYVNDFIVSELSLLSGMDYSCLYSNLPNSSSGKMSYQVISIMILLSVITMNNWFI